MYADLVLPVTALFETPNVTHSVRSAVISISEAGVTPPGECKTDLEITREVAKRFGLEQYFNEDPSVYIGRVLEPAGITYEELAEKKGINAWDLNPDYIAYKDGEFLTSHQEGASVGSGVGRRRLSGDRVPSAPRGASAQCR
ncbi:MAG: molybdopterin-dependent oxidoreductase [Adlercreutzia equolifaciens]